MHDFTGFLIVTDIDGTLYNSERRISPETYEALARYQEAGGLFTVATGRTPREFAPFDRSVINAPVVVSSGSLILHQETDEPLLDLPFGNDSGEILRAIERDYPCVIGVFSDDSLTRPCWRRGEGSIKSLLTAFDRPWHKAILEVAAAEDREPLEQELNSRWGDRYVFDSAWVRSVEMHRGDKGTGIAALRRLMGERARIVICVGDHTNDIPMIRAADIGCAVANALEVTKAAADHVTVSNDEHAIRYIIEHAQAWAAEKGLV